MPRRYETQEGNPADKHHLRCWHEILADAFGGFQSYDRKLEQMLDFWEPKR